MKKKYLFFNLKSASENIDKNYMKNLIKEISTQELRLHEYYVNIKKMIIMFIFVIFIIKLHYKTII